MTPAPTSVHDYLALGLAPNRQLANEFVASLLERARTVPKARPSTDVLAEIVADCVGNSTEIVVPLTGGLDSGALLGAALDAYPAHMIRCVTLGRESHPDVIVARELCARHGLDHEVCHPDTIEWSMDQVCDTASRLAGEALPPLDGLYTFAALADLVPHSAPVLSGHLGYLAKGNDLRDGRTAIIAFLAGNRGLGDNNEKFADLQGFLHMHKDWRAEFQGLTDTDLLELGFRQSQRVGPAMTNAFVESRRPYEDERWVAAWLRLPLTRRRNQTLYREIVTRGYPLIFGNRSQPSAGRRMYRTLRKRIPNRWRTAARRAKPTMLLGRGDPRTNPSLRRVALEAATSFDMRGIFPLAYLPHIERFVDNPTDQGFSIFKWILTAEVYLRLGRLK